MSVVGEDGFGMKLDTVDGINDVVDGHDFILLCCSVDLHAFGHGFVINDQGMITGHRKGWGNPMKQLGTVMVISEIFPCIGWEAFFTDAPK